MHLVWRFLCFLEYLNIIVLILIKIKHNHWLFCCGFNECNIYIVTSSKILCFLSLLSVIERTPLIRLHAMVLLRVVNYAHGTRHFQSKIKHLSCGRHRCVFPNARWHTVVMLFCRDSDKFCAIHYFAISA